MPVGQSPTPADDLAKVDFMRLIGPLQHALKVGRPFDPTGSDGELGIHNDPVLWQ